MLYPNLRAEMARQGLTIDKLATMLGISAASLSQKLRGLFPFTLNEAKKIKALLNVDIPLEELFKVVG